MIKILILALQLCSNVPNDKLTGTDIGMCILDASCFYGDEVACEMTEKKGER